MQTFERLAAWVDDLRGDTYREVRVQHYADRDRGTRCDPALVVVRLYRARGAWGEYVASGSGSTFGEAAAAALDAYEGVRSELPEEVARA